MDRPEHNVWQRRMKSPAARLEIKFRDRQARSPFLLDVAYKSNSIHSRNDQRIDVSPRLERIRDA